MPGLIAAVLSLNGPSTSSPSKLVDHQLILFHLYQLVENYMDLGPRSHAHPLPFVLPSYFSVLFFPLHLILPFPPSSSLFPFSSSSFLSFSPFFLSLHVENIEHCIAKADILTLFT